MYSNVVWFPDLQKISTCSCVSQTDVEASHSGCWIRWWGGFGELVWASCCLPAYTTGDHPLSFVSSYPSLEQWIFQSTSFSVERTHVLFSIENSSIIFFLHVCITVEPFFVDLREILWILFCFSPSGLNFWNSRKMLQILHLCSAHGSKKSLAGLHCKRVWKRGGSGSCWGADHSKSVTKHAWRCYWVCVLCPFSSPLWQWEEHNNNNNEEGFTFGKIFGEICNSSIGS